jgi:hypothetical protein
MKKTASAILVVAALLVSVSALSQTEWRKVGVTLGWVKQPNPDETGKSTSQRTKLLGSDTLTYNRIGQSERYVLSIVDAHGIKAHFTLAVPKGTVAVFTAARCEQALCEEYTVDRSDGSHAAVEYSTNAPPESPLPDTGLVTQ